VNIKIQQEFIKWYFHKPFPNYDSSNNRNSFLNQFFSNNVNFNSDTLRYWLELAFHEGAKAQERLKSKNVEN